MDLFWRKNQAASAPSDAPPSGAPLADAEHERTLEATAAVLRALGRDAFDVGDTPASEIAETFERWAAHVLVLGPTPGDETEKRERAEAPAVVRRDWAKLARFVTRHRKKEQQHVVQTTTEMRDVILTFVRCLGRASMEQGKTSKTLRAKVDRLRVSVERNSIEELKASALGVAEAVTQALEEQERRMQDQTRELSDRLSRLQQDLEDAKSESSTDALTKLQNRRAFDAALDSAVALAAVIERPVCLVMVDVDHFKSINDRFGHPVGDRVLRTIADSLARSFPRRGDIVARYGGEEFACLLAGASREDARMLTERMMTTIRSLRLELGGQPLEITVSAGIGILRPGESGDELVGRTDRALYDAKRGGRDRIVEADERTSGTHLLVGSAQQAQQAPHAPQAAGASRR